LHLRLDSKLLAVMFARGQVPDKALTQPSLGREIVRVFSLLHDELRGRAAAAGQPGAAPFMPNTGACAPG
jgi:hypothetical protein